MSDPEKSLRRWITDDEWWEQLGSAGFDPSYESWCKRAVDEAIAEETTEDVTFEFYDEPSNDVAGSDEPF